MLRAFGELGTDLHRPFLSGASDLERSFPRLVFFLKILQGVFDGFDFQFRRLADLFHKEWLASGEECGFHDAGGGECRHSVFASGSSFSSSSSVDGPVASMMRV